MKRYKFEEGSNYLCFDEYAGIDTKQSKQWNIKIDIIDILGSKHKKRFQGKSIIINLFAYKYLTNKCKLSKRIKL